LIVTGNLTGDPTPPEPPRHLARSEHFAAAHDGFWIADVRAGDMVAAGQQLGRILSLTGEVLDTLAAARDGVIIFSTTSAAVKQDGLLLNLGS
jgi:predicted deacylase